MAEAPTAEPTTFGAPIRGSRKAHLHGSRPDLRVPVREILLEDGDGTGVFRVYDSSGPYTDPSVRTDARRGLASVRGAWIRERGDVEEYAGADAVGICIYRYPPDAVVGAADALVEAIVGRELDAVTFTSAAAVDGLVAASVQIGEWPAVRRRLNAMIVVAVGPVTADALARNAVAVHVQPAEPRMGPMMRELAARVGQSGVSLPAPTTE